MISIEQFRSHGTEDSISGTDEQGSERWGGLPGVTQLGTAEPRLDLGLTPGLQLSPTLRGSLGHPSCFHQEWYSPCSCVWQFILYPGATHFRPEIFVVRWGKPLPLHCASVSLFLKSAHTSCPVFPTTFLRCIQNGWIPPMTTSMARLSPV